MVRERLLHGHGPRRDRDRPRVRGRGRRRRVRGRRPSRPTSSTPSTERNYGVVHRLRRPDSATATSWDIELSLRPDGVRVGRDQLGGRPRLRLRRRGHRRCRQPARFPRPVRPGDHSICSRPCRTTPRTCATPEFLDGREDTDADDAELMLKTSVDLPARRTRSSSSASRATTAAATSPSACSRWTTACSRRTTTRLSLFDAKDQRANGFVKWTMDFDSCDASSSARAASSRTSTSTRRCPRRSPRRPTSWRRSASTSSTATRSSHRGHLRVQPERAPALGRD